MAYLQSWPEPSIYGVFKVFWQGKDQIYGAHLRSAEKASVSGIEGPLSYKVRPILPKRLLPEVEGQRKLNTELLRAFEFIFEALRLSSQPGLNALVVQNTHGWT